MRWVCCFHHTPNLFDCQSSILTSKSISQSAQFCYDASRGLAFGGNSNQGLANNDILHSQLLQIVLKSLSDAEKTWLLFITHIILGEMQSIETSTQSIEPAIDLGAVLPAEVATEQGSHLYLYIIGIIILGLGLIAIFKRKSKPSRKQIALVGERGAGKTQLFIGLCGGKPFQTVPSITNNTTSIELSGKAYKICDFIGDNLSKEELLSELPRFHTVIHVVDGTDSKKLSDAALFIYRMLINKVFQKDPCNYVLFLNKDDEKSFHGQEKLIKRIEDQIQTIKSSRKNQSEDNQGQEDYLRNDRTRFSLKGQGILVVGGSAKSNRQKLVDQLEELCG